jgi:hypothetical protein
LLNEGVELLCKAAEQREEGKANKEEDTVARSADKFAIQKCVKEYVFPKQKFDTDGNLDFSNDEEMSICQCMAAVLNVDNQNIENWWETARKTVKESIYRHRNNTIKKIKQYSKGMSVQASISTKPF